MRRSILRPNYLRNLSLGLITAGLSMLAGSAYATYSIVVADKDTRQIGSAVTSCVSGASVARVFGIAPGIGGINAQAFSNREGRDLAVRAFQSDFDARTNLEFISSTRYDARSSLRQYGIVDFDQAAAYSGADNGPYAGAITEEGFRYNNAIQGNILTGPRVLSQTEQGFRAPACDLAERLVNALEFGALNGEGDSRCRPARPSDAAFIQVTAANGQNLVRIDVRGSRRPLETLRQRFNEWRRQNPCQVAAN